ncbi:hypothetical protein ACQEU8_26495 [Streptomyces sp. CA-250714]|uniref:hypothetical protein n=1 Tax=Streptomyces sp. CA-250714 TaxID=3240060 RepID=UPI003D912BDC
MPTSNVAAQNLERGHGGMNSAQDTAWERLAEEAAQLAAAFGKRRTDGGAEDRIAENLTELTAALGADPGGTVVRRGALLRILAGGCGRTAFALAERYAAAARERATATGERAGAVEGGTATGERTAAAEGSTTASEQAAADGSPATGAAARTAEDAADRAAEDAATRAADHAEAAVLLGLAERAYRLAVADLKERSAEAASPAEAPALLPGTQFAVARMRAELASADALLAAYARAEDDPHTTTTRADSAVPRLRAGAVAEQVVSTAYEQIRGGRQQTERRLSRIWQDVKSGPRPGYDADTAWELVGKAAFGIDPTQTPRWL